MVVFCHHFMGDMGALAVALEEYTRDAVRRGDRYTLTTFLRYRALVQLARDDVAGARALLGNPASAPMREAAVFQDAMAVVGRAELALYRGESGGGLAAWRHASQAFRSSLLTKVVQITRTEAQWTWGRVALAEHRERPARTLLREALRSARRIEREQIAYARVWASLLAAAVHRARGRDERALALLDRAIDAGEASDMLLWAACALRRKGEIAGGDAGRDWIAVADARMHRLGIASPARMTDLIAPGF
jgi:hypothetical protein